MNAHIDTNHHRPFSAIRHMAASAALAAIALAPAVAGMSAASANSSGQPVPTVRLVAAEVGPLLADDDFDPNRKTGGGAYGVYTCKSGFVWRDSYEGDHLCVTPAERKKVHDDNPDRQPGGGAYGAYTCKQGFVWRDSYDGDYACVTPQERDEERREAGRS